MAHIGKLPGYQRIVTTHNSKGEAVIDKNIEIDAPFDGSIEQGSAAFSLGYITSQFPVDMNGDMDIDNYKNFLKTPPGIVDGGGTVLRIVDISPGGTSPMHRTVSLDYGVVLIGDIELILDSGETKLMKPGDVCIQRSTMHAWRNVSQTEWARMLYVLQPSVPFRSNGKDLGEDYGGMIGVRASS